MKHLKILIFLLMLIKGNISYARELCDCYGSCVTIQQRDVSIQIKRVIKKRDGYSPYDKVEIDHKIPLCLGGSNEIDNLWSLTKEQHALKTKNDLDLLYYVNTCLMTIQEAQEEAKKWKPKSGY